MFSTFFKHDYLFYTALEFARLHFTDNIRLVLIYHFSFLLFFQTALQFYRIQQVVFYQARILHTIYLYAIVINEVRYI